MTLEKIQIWLSIIFVFTGLSSFGADAVPTKCKEFICPPVSAGCTEQAVAVGCGTVICNEGVKYSRDWTGDFLNKFNLALNNTKPDELKPLAKCFGLNVKASQTGSNQYFDYFDPTTKQTVMRIHCTIDKLFRGRQYKGK